VTETVPTISSPQVSTISMTHDVLDPVTLDQILHPISNTMTNTSATVVQQPMRRDNVPQRLKRSYVEVDDIMVTSSAKRAIVPTAAFITSFSPLHQLGSPQLGSKQMWGTETASMIIDQHNNNG